VAQERKEDKKIQKKYTHTIIFPLLNNNKDFFPSYKKFNKDFLSLSFSLSLSLSKLEEEEDSPFRVFIFYL
jgi:hypothetical protein